MPTPNTTWKLHDASRNHSPGSGVDSPYLALNMLFGAAGMDTYLHSMPLYWLGWWQWMWIMAIRYTLFTCMILISYQK